MARNKGKRKEESKHPIASYLEEVEKHQWRPHPVYGVLEQRRKKEKYIQDKKVSKTKKNKDMNYKQARDTHGLPPFGNYDGDRYDNGVPVLNAMDCRPFDPMRHGIGSFMIGAVKKGAQVADRVASRAIHGVQEINNSQTAQALREAHRERVNDYSQNMEEFQRRVPRQQEPIKMNMPRRHDPFNMNIQRPTPNITINVDRKFDTLDDIPQPVRPHEMPTNNPPITFAENRQTGAIVYPIRGPLNPALYKIQQKPKKDFEKILKEKGIRL